MVAFGLTANSISRANVMTERSVHRLLLAFLFAASLMSAACSEQEEASAPAPPPAVVVAPVMEKEVADVMAFTGRVEATKRVDLKARVTGFLEQRLFEEGGAVREGDLLFVIEKAPYIAAVNQAKSELAQAEAALAQAEATLRRVQRAVKSGAVSKQQLDEAAATAKVQAAAVLGAKSRLEKAQLDLGYTEIRSPISGRISRETYTVGNLVGPESDPLATVVSEHPIHVVIPVSQRLILDYQKHLQETGEGRAVLIRLRLNDGTLYPEVGEINFADISISRETDTLDVRAVFPNPGELLVDGQFVSVIAERAESETGLVVPRSAVQIDQAGRYVLVVDGENTVERRRVEIDQEQGAEVVVESGLKEGERIIIEGIQKVRPGQRVAPTEAEAVLAPPGT
jgi:membrane fusion protein (multidrug efflux system)